MLPHVQPRAYGTAHELIADPLQLGRFGSCAEVIKAVLMHPDMVGNIERVERAMFKHDQMPCPVIHRFGPGVYIREITLPAGAFCIGAEHKVEHLNVMLQGRVTVRNEHGGTTELVAPLTFTGKPGKKVGYVHEDVVWQNIWATDETDIETLESMFVIKGDPWEEDKRARMRPSLHDDCARVDYRRVLREWGISHEVALSQSRNTEDMMPFPYGGYKVMVTDSPIDGRGLFATADIQPGEVIAPGRIGDKRTPAGRYTNHSLHPNADVVRTLHGVELVANRPIAGMTGGRVGEEITINYRQALELRKQLCHP